MLARGASNLVCWPSDVCDTVAADFSAALIPLLFKKTIAEAFHQATALVPSQERGPKLLSRQCARSKPEDHVVLEYKGKSSGSKEFEGFQGQVVHRSAVNGWVNVVITQD